ncbi:unnamed protein product [Blepharisma stoltei]|uniref:P-type ATPase A domain-containing protein n=1 Tax=Blepharisma stoltei TaxID=1481888 RepID=A0AAU9IVP0_9CILI|nr:unnamed protein product [Blepharisma stoltei]
MRCFVALQFPYTQTYSQLHEKFGKGLTSDSQYRGRLSLFGHCMIDVPMPGVLKLLVTDVMHPFFIFQIFSIGLWLWEEYYYYSVAIFVCSIAALCASLIETRSSIKAVRELAMYECSMTVFRNGCWSEQKSHSVVPGDLVKIPLNIQLPCDIVLTKGICLVDECMLTGESQPELKDALPVSNQLIYINDKRYTLSSGTVPLTLRGDPEGIVIATGFSTAKGELVKSILFPKPNRFKFYTDSFKFIGLMSLFGLFGFLWYLGNYIQDGESLVDTLMSCFDLVTTIVPPALPLAMSVGMAFAVVRLKEKKIMCISPPSVNAAGRVSIICFDKTGTLTEDSMTLKGVWEPSNQEIHEDLTTCPYELQESMASCHSLIILDDHLVGDPQEVAIFNRLNWKWTESEEYRFVVTNGQHEAKVKHLYHFTSLLKRMGVIIEHNCHLKLHMKGAPEVIIPLCINVPDNLSKQIFHYTKQGLRVLACATKTLQTFDSHQSLSEIENGLTFLGLLILQNHLKPESKETIQTLLKAEVKCVISTGDALLTGLSVAKECGLVPEGNKVLIGDLINEKPHWEDDEGNTCELTNEKGTSLALTGNLLQHYISYMDPIVSIFKDQAVIFGRMSPQQKILVIEQLQYSDLLVAMVGDGANDCGALKAADVGLSLSEAEASIAAPFTGKKLNSIIEVLKEGRASLVTSFQAFKFIAFYSMIEFVLENVLFIHQNNMLDRQFMYIDLVLILILAITMSYTRAYDKLATELPPGVLFSLEITVPIFMQACILMGIQWAAYYSLQYQSWYSVPKDTSVVWASEVPDNTVLFLTGAAEVLFTCIALNDGPPFRMPFRSNYWFTGFAIFFSFMQVYMTLVADEVTREIFQMVYLELDYKLQLEAILLGGFAIIFIFERYIVPILSRKLRTINCKRKVI